MSSESSEGAVARWWDAVTRRGGFVHAAVVGARGTGKTTWFRSLADADPKAVALWDVRRVARARSMDEVWADLFAVLDVERTPGGDPLDDLEDRLDALDHGPVLVVDDWDAAVERGAPIGDCCYEVLDRLVRFCLGQATTRAGAACLGLVLVTSLPDVSDLEYFTRREQRPTFERLSRLVTRSFTAERFPLLGRAESEALLRGAGLPDADARAAADACGGWPWLLTEAAAAARAHGGWTSDAAQDVRERRLPVLLDAALLPCLAVRPEVRMLGGAPLDYLVQELDRLREPAAFGLPHAFDDPGRPAPLVRDLLTRRFLVVDTENLRMPFQRHAEVAPDRYAGDVDAYLQPRVGAWLRRLCAAHRVAADDVWLVGRSQERIDRTVGAATPGRRLYPPAPLRRKARSGKNGSDDNLMTAEVAREAQRNPLARFVLATGDADAPFILDVVGALDQVTVCTPWEASGALRRRLAGGDRLIEHTFRERRPPEVRRRTPPGGAR
ncbi:hypothetical protein BTM25_24990 [Actinomadura rubteroloni]|uniref:Uncharacterized protein n=1 Tax=Actinomadura rubteroloni TaxID=1926885 RepID=A0A2P4UFP2_9ACTN|nr:hypothetical protein [Actinomadura rubteroloni]POM23873.1 hypothetical protein BTM25_24990 [Actinomadura rubteroloni]